MGLGLISAAAGLGKSVIAPALASFGVNWLSDKFIGQPQADRAFDQSTAATALAYERQKEMFKHRYRWTMEDMRAAGINPILAISRGFNVSGFPTVQKAQAFQAHNPYTASTGALDFAKMTTEKSKQEVMLEEKNKLYNEAKKLFAEAQRNFADAKLSYAKKENVRKEWWNIEQTFNHVTKQIESLEQVIELTKRKSDKTQQTIKQLDVLITEKNLEVWKLKKLNQRIKHLDKVWGEGKNPTLQRINEVLKALTGRL